MHATNMLKPTPFLFITISISIFFSTVTVTGYPVGGNHEPNGFSTTCAYFHWFMCDTPTKRADPGKEKRGSDEKMDVEIKMIKKLLLNKILDSKNKTISEKEHLIDEVLTIP